MDSEEYWRLFHLVRGDVEAAIGCNSTYQTIHRLARENQDVLDLYNRYADFWRATTHGLQSGFFMAFGRIFDRAGESFSIEDLVEQTIEHPGFFSKAELRKRKREYSHIYGDALDPDWLILYIDSATEPTRQNLELLRTELGPHIKKFKEVYGPVRHQYFAHRTKATEDVIAELFSKTNVTEAADILKSVYDLIGGIQDMAANGTLPGQWHHGHYESLYRKYESSAESFVRQLVEPIIPSDRSD